MELYLKSGKRENEIRQSTLGVRNRKPLYDCCFALNSKLINSRHLKQFYESNITELVEL